MMNVENSQEFFKPGRKILAHFLSFFQNRDKLIPVLLYSSYSNEDLLVRSQSFPGSLVVRSF